MRQQHKEEKRDTRGYGSCPCSRLGTFPDLTCWGWNPGLLDPSSSFFLPHLVCVVRQEPPDRPCPGCFQPPPHRQWAPGGADLHLGHCLLAAPLQNPSSSWVGWWWEAVVGTDGLTPSPLSVSLLAWGLWGLRAMVDEIEGSHQSSNPLAAWSQSHSFSCLVPLEAALLKWALQSWDLPGGWLLLRKSKETHLADLSSICRLSAKDWMHPRCPGAITKHQVPHFWAAFSPNYSIQGRYMASQAGFRQALLFQWVESWEWHIFSRVRVFTVKSTEPRLATSLLCDLDRMTSLRDSTNLCTD